MKLNNKNDIHAGYRTASLGRIPQPDYKIFFVAILLDRLRHHSILETILHKNFLLVFVGGVPGTQLEEATLLVELNLKQHWHTISTTTSLKAFHSELQSNLGTLTGTCVAHEVNCVARLVLGF